MKDVKNHAKHHARRLARCEANKARAKATPKLTPEQQLAKLDFRLGKGVGAKRERAKLAKRLEA